MDPTLYIKRRGRDLEAPTGVEVKNLALKKREPLLKK